MNFNKMVIASGTGFLGRAIINYTGNRWKEIVVLTRRALPPNGNVRFVEWDGSKPGDWMSEIDGADLLINLCGKSVNCRYTEQNKKEILDSRVNSTLILGAAVVMAKHPPKVWMNASSATAYKHSESRPQDEFTGELGDDFSETVCKKWEAAFFDSPTPNTRKIAIRIAIVLGRKGGMLPTLKKLAPFGLAGKFGSGRQMMSWIHEQDLVRCIEFIYERNEISGPVNCVAPHVLTNADFMKTFRKHSNAPFGIPQPVWMLKLGAIMLGTETELILKSRWAQAKKLDDAGFKFKYDTADRALENLCGSSQKR